MGVELIYSPFMNASSGNSNLLVQKLDAFIRKYYKNQLLKGAIYSLAILFSTYLLVVILEYFGQFGTGMRTLLFFVFLVSVLAVLVYYVLLPLLHLYRIGKTISYEEAAQIVGRHFKELQDKLLNTLQLQARGKTEQENELLMASIEQRMEFIRPIPFTAAVNLAYNRRYLPYLFTSLGITLILLLFWPQVISKGTERLVNFNRFYEKEMPFMIGIENSALKTLQGEDFTLTVKVTGISVPAELLLLLNGMEYRMEKTASDRFRYVFSKPQSNTDFQFNAAGFISREYTLEVLPKPVVLEFSAELHYPAYLNMNDELLENSGNLRIPQGTRVTWRFRTRNTEGLFMRFADSSGQVLSGNGQAYTYSRRFLQGSRYLIRPFNQQTMALADSMLYDIEVIPDLYPTVSVDVEADSLQSSKLYFSGLLKDDHGFESLDFYYTHSGQDSAGNPIRETLHQSLALSKQNATQPFFHFLDVSLLGLMPGDKVEYYFEVKDNDAVNGFKSTRSATFVYKAPTLEELSKTTDQNNSRIKKELESGIKKARDLQKEVNELSKKINDKKQPGYEEKKQLRDLLDKQSELQKQIEQLKTQNQQNNSLRNEFSSTDESILEKQQELEKLFDQVMTPEMKKLFDELREMLEKMDKNMVQEKLEELKLSNKDIEKELDRNLELFKQLEVQQKMQEAIDRLDDLQKQEEKLNRETEGKDEQKEQDKQNKEGAEKNEKANSDKKEPSKKAEAQDLKNKQEEISKQFEQLKKDLKELEQKNKALEEPNSLPKTEDKQEEISQDMENSSKELGQNNRKKASGAQKSAAQKMQEMKEQMEESLEEQESSQNEENAQALRQILENLLHLSFAQEDLIQALPKTRIDNPQYIQIPKQQNKLREDSRIIEDSLLALSKREPRVSATINREISAINLNMDKTVKSLAERNSGESLIRMQGTMTSVNNLALLLNESLEQMQNEMKQQMQSKSQKSGKCKKPGSSSGKNPSSQGQPTQNLRKMQEQLNKQLQEMKEALEKGQKPGEKPGDKNGQKPGNKMAQDGKMGNGLPSSSEQFAKMAAQQEALRRQMQELMDKLKNKGSNPGGDLTKLMEQTERDLVNKQLTNETMRRQQDILSRLLESEKAEREREQDEQRKSHEAKNQEMSNPERFLEYKRLKEKEMELLQTVPPGLTPYYKEKVNNYFNGLSKP